MSDDPVAQKSAFLCMYMSNHPDTLVAYVVQHTKQTNVSTAKMESIDSNGMNLSYNLSGDASKYTVRIPFDPPLAGYEEVRPRLVTMTADAKEEIGMTPLPVIREFSIPWKGMVVGPTPLQGLLVWVTFSTSQPAEQLRNFLGPGVINISWGAVVVLHSIEALYMASLCRRHSTGPVTGAAWCIGTLVLGWPFWMHFKRLVQDARIRSVMKSS